MKHIAHKRYLIAALAILMLLLAGAAFVLTRLLHLDSYKDQILAEVQRTLNRQVLYETGTVSFRFGPQFVFTKVVVKEKGSAADFARINRLTIKLALFPLLEKKLVLRDVVLDKPVIELSRDQSGVFNFSDLLEKKKGEITLQMQGMHLQNAEIHFLDRKAAPEGLSTTFKNTDLSLNHLNRGKSCDFKLAATIAYEGQKGSISLAGTAKVAAKGKPLRDTTLNAAIVVKNLYADHFWPYYSHYVPFRQIHGVLNVKSSFKGKINDFTSKGKVRIANLRFDYPQVFHAVLAPHDIDFSYDLALSPVVVSVKSLNLTVDGLNVKGNCAIRDINTSDPRITAHAKTSTFNLQNFAQYVPYGIIVKGPADFIEQHVKEGIYRLDEGRLDGRISQILHMERGDNYNVLFIKGRVEKGLVTYGRDVPTFNSIKGTLEMRGKDFNLVHMSGNFGTSPFTLDGKIADYPLNTPSTYPFSMNITPHLTELAWLLGKENGARLGFGGKSSLHLTGAGTTGSYNLAGEWQLTQASYSYPNLINKPAARPNTLSFRGSITDKEVKLDALRFNLASMSLNIGASYRFADRGQVALDVKSNQFQVGDVASMFPYAMKYQATGRLQAMVHGKGPGDDPAKLRWSGNILCAGCSFKPGESIKTVSNITGTIHFSGDTLETSQIAARLGNSTIYARGNLVGFANPTLNLAFSSPSLDLSDFGLRTPEKEVRLTHAQGNIALEDNDLRIRSFSTQLNNSILNLKGTVEDVRNPTINVSVTSPYLEVEDLILVSKLARISRKETPSPVLTLEASFQVDAGKVRGVAFEKLRSTVQYENNILYLHPIDFSALGGHVAGQARIDFGLDGAARYQINYDLSRLSAEQFMNAFGIKNREITGTMALRGNLTAKGKNSEDLKKSVLGAARLSLEEGSIRKFAVLSKVFSILNVSQLLKFQLPDMVSGGMPYNKITAAFAVKDGVVSSNDLFIDSDAMNISAVGKLDLAKGELDATIGVKPLQTVDKVVSHIPIVGWILTGENKTLITAYFEAKGKLDDPTVNAIPVKSMTRGVFNIFKRVFELPAKLFTDTGEVIIGK